MSLKKIAEMTGVSISTVSRVLNNKEYNCASEEVKRKIWKAAEEIQYVPNESARNLKLGGGAKVQSPTIKLAVILGRFESLDDDPFFAELYRYVEQEAFTNACTIAGPFVQSDIYKKSFPDADGFIILGRSQAKLLEDLKKINKNVIAIGRNHTHFEIDEVICDGRRAAAIAMEYLIEKGNKHIAYIGDCSYENRYVGYCDTLIRHGFPMDYSNIFSTNQTTEAGYAAMKQLMENNTCDAVFCANDATAIGVLNAYNESKKRNRKYLDIISIDNIKAAEEITPLLTTVHIPMKDMGKMAVKILLDRINKGHTENLRVELPSHLIIRDSC